MDITHIIIDDANPAHRELSIYRTGEINRIRLSDKTYSVYARFKVTAHNHTALFHYGIVESLDVLPFISETGHGLDSWDEAFLHHSQLGKMLALLKEGEKSIDPKRTEKALLGWHDTPAAAYWRKIDPKEFLSFLDELKTFVSETIKGGYDLEFIL